MNEYERKVICPDKYYNIFSLNANDIRVLITIREKHMSSVSFKVVIDNCSHLFC